MRYTGIYSKQLLDMILYFITCLKFRLSSSKDSLWFIKLTSKPELICGFILHKYLLLIGRRKLNEFWSDIWIPLNLKVESRRMLGNKPVSKPYVQGKKFIYPNLDSFMLYT